MSVQVKEKAHENVRLLRHVSRDTHTSESIIKGTPWMHECKNCWDSQAQWCVVISTHTAQTHTSIYANILQIQKVWILPVRNVYAYILLGLAFFFVIHFGSTMIIINIYIYFERKKSTAHWTRRAMHAAYNAWIFSVLFRSPSSPCFIVVGTFFYVAIHRETQTTMHKHLPTEMSLRFGCCAWHTPVMRAKIKKQKCAWMWREIFLMVSAIRISKTAYCTVCAHTKE